jgi:hypothetical protein
MSNLSFLLSLTIRYSLRPLMQIAEGKHGHARLVHRKSRFSLFTPCRSHHWLPVPSPSSLPIACSLLPPIPSSLPRHKRRRISLTAAVLPPYSSRSPHESFLPLAPGLRQRPGGKGWFFMQWNWTWICIRQRGIFSPTTRKLESDLRRGSGRMVTASTSPGQREDANADAEGCFTGIDPRCSAAARSVAMEDAEGRACADA